MDDDEQPYPGPVGAHLLSRAAAAGISVGFLGLVTGLFTSRTATVVFSAVWMVAWVVVIVLALRAARRRDRRQLDQPAS